MQNTVAQWKIRSNLLLIATRNILRPHQATVYKIKTQQDGEDLVERKMPFVQIQD